MEFQMSSKMNWNNFRIENVKPIPKIDASKEKELNEVLKWGYTQPLLKKDSLRKDRKIDFHEYILQVIKIINSSN